MEHYHHNHVLPKGFGAIRVGKEEEELQRFVVPIACLNHSLFMDLLKEAEEEYAYKQEGAITILCNVGHYLEVRDAIERSITCRAVHHYHHCVPPFHFTGCMNIYYHCFISCYLFCMY